MHTLIGLGFFPLMYFSFEDLKTLHNFLPSCSPVTPQSLEVFFSVSAMVNMLRKADALCCGSKPVLICTFPLSF